MAEEKTPARKITERDRQLARICLLCPICRRARKKQRGVAYWVSKHVEGAICPFCKAYERVYGRKSHEPYGDRKP
jgi:hypothetical protein